MGVTDDRRRIIAAQPHLVRATGESVAVNIAEPKLQRLAVTFAPVQSGSGTPSPDNVRPISGWSTISVALGSQTASITLGGTYYGGVVDLVSGVMTVTHGIVDLGSLTWELRNNNSTRQAWRATGTIPIKTEAGGNYKLHGISTQFASVSLNDSWVPYIISYNDTTTAQQLVITFPSSAYDTADQAKVALSGIPLVYELATPQTVQLSPQTIAALRGQQTVTSPAGAVEISCWTH